MALTGPQKEKIRFYCGWSERFHAFDSRLDMALAAVDVLPEVEAHLTNAATGDPPGIIALLDEKVTQLRGVTDRLKASAVGSITLNPAELYQLRSEGRRLTGQLCAMLGVERRHDVFGSSSVRTFQGLDGPEGTGNYVGR